MPGYQSLTLLAERLSTCFAFTTLTCLVNSNLGYNIGLYFTEKGYRESGNINGGIYLASKNIFDNFDLDEKFTLSHIGSFLSQTRPKHCHVLVSGSSDI